MTLTVQFVTIFTMIAGGVYLGAAIDTFRRFEPLWKKRRVFSWLSEICFWMLQTLVLFYLLYRVNYGELRFYILLALICGFAAYKSLLERLYKSLLEAFIHFVTSIFRLFIRLVQAIIIRPIKGLLRLIFILAMWLWGVIVWLLLLLLSIILFPFKLLIQLIWRFLPGSFKNYLHRLAGFCSRMKNKISAWWENITSKRR